jgi:hypothetical protein
LKSYAWAFSPPIGMKIGDFQRSSRSPAQNRQNPGFQPQSRLERSRWRGGGCDSDTSDIMGFNRVLNRPSPLAAISLLFCLLPPKVDSISHSLTASAANASGFLQVAVSEAPSQSACELELLRAGAPDTALSWADFPFPVILGKPRPSGRDIKSGCTMSYCLCRGDNQALRMEHQVCRVPKDRRSPDRL